MFFLRVSRGKFLGTPLSGEGSTPCVLSQKAEKQLSMFSFVREKINHHILSYVIDSLCEVDDLLVLLMDASLALMTPRITAIASALSNGGCNKF